MAIMIWSCCDVSSDNGDDDDDDDDDVKNVRI